MAGYWINISYNIKKQDAPYGFEWEDGPPLQFLGHNLTESNVQRPNSYYDNNTRLVTSSLAIDWDPWESGFQVYERTLAIRNASIAQSYLDKPGSDDDPPLEDRLIIDSLTLENFWSYGENATTGYVSSAWVYFTAPSLSISNASPVSEGGKAAFTISLDTSLSPIPSR